MAEDYCGDQIRLDPEDPNDLVLDSPNQLSLNCGSKIPAGFRRTPGSPQVKGSDIDNAVAGQGKAGKVRGNDSGKLVGGNSGTDT